MAMTNKQAEKTFKTMCKALDKLKWRYDADPSELCIDLDVKGEDLTMPLRIQVSKEQEYVRVLGFMPEKVSTDNIEEVALAVGFANDSMLNGHFDLNVETGNLVFRISTMLDDGMELSMEAAEYMIYTTCATLDEYNDKFLAVSQFDMDIDEFCDSFDD